EARDDTRREGRGDEPSENCDGLHRFARQGQGRALAGAVLHPRAESPCGTRCARCERAGAATGAWNGDHRRAGDLHSRGESWRADRGRRAYHRDRLQTAHRAPAALARRNRKNHGGCKSCAPETTAVAKFLLPLIYWDLFRRATFPSVLACSCSLRGTRAALARPPGTRSTARTIM